jgi:PQQ-like domain
VRLAAARALANLGERKDVLQTLVALLESENTRVRARSYQNLRSLTGQQIAFLPEAKAADRAAAVKAWQQWLETSGATAALFLPLTEQAVPLGRTLFVSQAQGTVTELDADHKQRWQIRLPGPAWGCQGLPNGHRLIAVYAHNLVIEYDDMGKEVWKKDRLPGPPYSVQRLDNGSTLVACPTAQQVIEISPDGSTTAIAVPGGPFSAQRLESGNTLVALQQGNRVVEVDRAGKTVWEARVGSTPFHAVRLDSGNTLVCLTQGRQVVELDPTGKALVWRTQVPLTNPYAAQRLPSGNTMVADHMGLHEIDASGKQVWDLRQPQLSGLSSF